MLKKVIVDELVIVLSCIVSSKRFDHNELFLGFSCGKDESTVARKAVSESMVNYTAINDKASVKNEDISKVPFNGFKPYYFDPTEVSEVLSYLNQKQSEIISYCTKKNNISFENIDISAQTFKGLEIFGCKAIFNSELELSTRFINEVAIV